MPPVLPVPFAGHMPHMPVMPGAKDARERDGKRGRDSEEGEVSKVKFFDKLPADELLDTELQLREIILDHLERFCRKNPGLDGPLLSDIGQDKAMQKLRSKFLPHQVPLREWIDRRIGGEVATKIASNGQVQIVPRNARGSKEASEEDNKDSEAVARREAFFESLPPDGFTPEEENLRDVLLNFLEAWTGPDPPNLGQAGSDPQVQKAKSAFIKKGSHVSLRTWVDRRIGGEVATWRVEGRAPDISLGLRDQWNDVATAALAQEAIHGNPDVKGGSGVSRSERKRKAADEGGKGKGGKGVPRIR